MQEWEKFGQSTNMSKLQMHEAGMVWRECMYMYMYVYLFAIFTLEKERKSEYISTSSVN